MAVSASSLFRSVSFFSFHGPLNLSDWILRNICLHLTALNFLLETLKFWFSVQILSLNEPVNSNSKPGETLTQLNISPANIIRKCPWRTFLKKRNVWQRARDIQALINMAFFALLQILGAANNWKHSKLRRKFLF